ncbi:MAG: NAD-dependent epimerase/dehydratase family protein [Thermoleophilaceae bacterium]
MRLLILGGTLFLGRHLAEEAMARGHDLTLFNRGRTAPELFPEAEHLRGDRDGDLGALREREWEAVIDTSGDDPGMVGESAALLASAVGHYTFVSSISAYGTFSEPGMDENAPTARSESEDVSEGYGARKAACERAVADAFPGRSCVVRSGLLIGPHDPTERFSVWVRRLAAGGRVRAPADHDQPVQLIDARDLAAWMLAGAEHLRVGTFNVTGPAKPVTLGDMLERVRAATGGGAELDWVDGETLLAEGLEPWDDVPLWLDLPRHPELRGFMAVEVARALAAGLAFRPIEETVRDLLAAQDHDL